MHAATPDTVGNTSAASPRDAFRLLFENSADGIMLLDPVRMVFIDVNPSGMKLLRYESSAHLLMQSPAQLSPAFQPDGRPSLSGIVEAVTRAIRDGSHRLEWLCRRHNGECFPAEVSITSLEPGETPLLAIMVRDITDRKLSEDALRAERARMKATLDVAIDCIVTIDAAGTVLDWNPAAERTFGWSREEAVGREMADLIIPPELRGRHRHGLERALAGENRIIGQRVELPALHRDGHTFPVELSISRVETGGVPIFTGFIRDITERKRAESQIIERADRMVRYQTALMELTKSDLSDIGSALRMVTEQDALTIGVERVSVWFFDGQKSAIVCHDLFECARRQHSEGVTLAAAGYPRYFAALATQRTIAAANAATDPATSEFREGYLEPLGIGAMLDVPIWRNGRMIGVVCHEHVGGPREWSHEEQQFAASMADVIALALEASERKQAEAEIFALNADLERRVKEATTVLRHQAEELSEANLTLTLFKAVADGTSDFVCIANLHAEMIYMNPAGRALLGFAAEDDVAGLSYERFASADYIQRSNEGGFQIAMDKGFWQIDTTLRHCLGHEIAVSIVGLGIKAVDGTPTHFAAVARDMTRRVAMEEELRLQADQLSDANEALARSLTDERDINELKTNFVNMISHEFRTPLGVIMSSTQILSKYFERLPPALRNEHLNDVFVATQRMGAIMEEVLLLARVDAGRLFCKPEPLELASFCRLLATDVDSSTSRKCPIRVSGSNEDARADPTLLRHIFTNLLNNAVKFSPGGCPVTLDVQRHGNDAIFVVSDHGMGIPAQDMATLFTAFHRGSNASETSGTGLGLVIVKRCVTLHGGSVEVQSVVGQGTTFTVRLPLLA